MAPTPQEVSPEMAPPLRPRPAKGEEVVITGMSGIFPMSDSVQQFVQNLYDKVDMVSTDEAGARWVYEHPEVPRHLGKVDGVGRFDAQFFRVHHKQAATMEPMSTKLLEHAYGAIYDSGNNPQQLRGKKIGVFIGATHSESEKGVIYENVQKNGFGITGCNKAMYANRISYWIDGKGPSYSLDLACASSAACVEHAYRSISSGLCEAAIVGGSNLCMHPSVCLNMKRAGYVTLDGKTKCFDKNGDGHVRSDGISVLFLQKAKDAKRIYSEVYHAKCTFSPTSKQLVPIREVSELAGFFEAFYSEIGVSPSDVEYIEANGAALVEADTNELTAIGRVFGKKQPVKVGCVKSNMGSSEPASGACSLAKVCYAYQNGKLPGNLHYNDPIDIQQIKDGRIQVLTDTTDFNRGLVALNSLSYSGANVHVLLKGHYKEKDLNRYKSSIPSLVLLSGRKDECVQPLLAELKQKVIDPEEIGLLHNIHQYDIVGHMSRGYTILDKDENNKTVSLAESVKYYTGAARPIWFVYSGMGSQWATMGADLMRIPIFAAAIQKCHNILEPKGIDIVRILTEADKTIYDNILHSFVGIAAVQIGLTDILTSLGIVPDKIIGHSVGELGCAYADGCFTAEEMILSAYSRGLVSVQTPFIRGSMAAVGLGYKDILSMCPPGIEVACHNSSESSTISGPADIMKEFVASLTARGIFAKEVPCSNIAYHSKYIADAGPALLKYLSEVIREPKARSSKWVSTSVPEAMWDEESAKYSSAEYHTNNLLNSVLFEEASRSIPKDALVIEIAPHGLLQAIIKRSLKECLHVPLTRRGTADPVKFLLEAIGGLYQEGLNLKIAALYPKIDFPVSSGTPMLSQHVFWEHSESWECFMFNRKHKAQAIIRHVVISLHDDDYAYMRGHKREDNYVLPEAALLKLVWENLAMHNGVNCRDLSVSFSEVHFYTEAVFKYNEPLKLEIVINKGNNKFQVSYEDLVLEHVVLVSGYIQKLNPQDLLHCADVEEDTDQVTLTAKDIYVLMRLKGYSYEKEFQSINSTSSKKTKANIIWKDNWTTFIDALFQLNLLAQDDNKIFVPSMITSLTIDVDKHKENVPPGQDSTFVAASLNKIQDRTLCGGVKLERLVLKETSIINNKKSVLLNQQFIPHFVNGLVELKTGLQLNLQLVVENVLGNEVQVKDMLSREALYIRSIFSECTHEIPDVKFNQTDSGNDIFHEEINLIVVDNLLGNNEQINKIHNSVPNGTFILTVEKDTAIINSKYKLFHIITAMSVQNQILILLRKNYQLVEDNTNFLLITLDRKFTWIPKVQAELKKSKNVVLVAERQPYSGLLGMVKKLRKEYGNRVRLVVVEDYHVPAFSGDKAIFKEQLQKQLAFNVLKKGHWGGYFYTSSDKNINNSKNLRLVSAKRTDIESLTWVEQEVDTTSNMRVQVSYAGPSFKDAQNAASHHHSNEYYGMDFSGISKSGERIMGLVAQGAIASSVEADPDLIWPVPSHWTLEDAATVPLAYTLAYYILNRVKVAIIDQVFIHGGAGALGQAFIAVCQERGYNVFTSVSDSEKKQFLMKLFPDLPEDNIFSSSSPNMVDIIKSKVKTVFNVIVNSASGTNRMDIKKLKKYRSYFVDLSDMDMVQGRDFNMSFLALSGSYYSIQLANIFKPEFVADKKKLHVLLSDGIAKGVVRPLSRVVYSPSDVCRAFRLLRGSGHRGKVLIRMNTLDTATLSVTPRMTYSLMDSYVVVCGNETVLGMEIADNLIKHGARNVVISLKPNELAGYCYTKFVSWKNQNVIVKLLIESLQTEKACLNLLQEATKLGSVSGIFIVQDFGGSESLEADEVAAKYNNTAGVIANLDLTSRKICNQLEYFVVVSHSRSKGITDEYMVSVADTICESRKDVQLPALSFHIGAVIEVDDESSEENKLPLKTVLMDLEMSLKQNYTVSASMVLKKTEVVFLDKISDIIGIKDINEVDESIYLKNILHHQAGIFEIQTLIREIYNINYTDDKIEELTVAELKHLSKVLDDSKPKIKDGLHALISYIDPDEWKAAEPGVSMVTGYSAVKMFEDDLDPKATYLMVMPGFEGHHELFTTLCERLKVQAVALQYGPEHADATIPEMADLIRKFLKKRFEVNSTFYLLGYSFGVNVALELARLLENEGHIGVVYCVDGSPDRTRSLVQQAIGSLDPDSLKTRLKEHVHTLLKTAQEKYGKSISSSHQYKECLIQGTFNRLTLALQYEPDFQLQSELILIKGQSDNLDYDYGLSKYSTKPVQIFEVDADHASIPTNCQVTNIVNRLLSPEILEAYKNKNTCLTYIYKKQMFLDVN